VVSVLYHDIVGGNDLMRVKGNWTNSYNKSKIDWMANGDERIKKMMENMKQKQDSIIKEYNKTDDYNRATFPFGN
jgi:hypothetical protein